MSGYRYGFVPSHTNTQVTSKTIEIFKIFESGPDLKVETRNLSFTSLNSGQ